MQSGSEMGLFGLLFLELVEFGLDGIVDREEVFLEVLPVRPSDTCEFLKGLTEIEV